MSGPAFASNRALYLSLLGPWVHDTHLMKDPVLYGLRNVPTLRALLARGLSFSAGMGSLTICPRTLRST